LAIVSYDGSRFLGLQSQKSSENTVIGKFVSALVNVGIFSKPVAAGRTDAGVHATYQPIAFDLPPFWVENLSKFGADFLRTRLNASLAPYIYIKKLYGVNSDFHPRFDARKRAYRYVISTRISPFCADYTAFAPSIDAAKIKSAIKLFEGEHDFSMFKKTGSETKSNVRRIFNAYAYEKDGLFVMKFVANGFLRSQIRMMSSFLLKILDGTLGENELREQLGCVKKHSSTLANAGGLYLCGVGFDKRLEPLK
jgi:tRNA pseudouridine38-40 synthase